MSEGQALRHSDPRSVRPDDVTTRSGARSKAQRPARTAGAPCRRNLHVNQCSGYARAGMTRLASGWASPTRQTTAPPSWSAVSTTSGRYESRTHATACARGTPPSTAMHASTVPVRPLPTQAADLDEPIASRSAESLHDLLRKLLDFQVVRSPSTRSRWRAKSAPSIEIEAERALRIMDATLGNR